MNLKRPTLVAVWLALVAFGLLGAAACQNAQDLSGGSADAGFFLRPDTASDRPAGKAADAMAPKADMDTPAIIVLDAVVAPSIDAGGTAALDGGIMPPPPSCTPTVSTLHPRSPEALLVQDRSTAMAEGLATGTKWLASTTAIMSAAASGSVAWGAMLYPKPTADGACCQMPANDRAPEVEVAPSLASAAAMAKALEQASATGVGRPLATAMVQGANYLSGRATSTAKYLVAIAAGDPTCATDALCTGAGTTDYTRTKDAVTRAASLLGIPVAVLAVGFAGSNSSFQPGSSQQFFSDLAKAGGIPNTAPGQPSYYAASSADEVTTALSAIAAQMKSCSFAIPAPLAPDAAGEVTFSDARVPRDGTHQDGWDFADERTSVVLYGKACSAVRAASGPVSIQLATSCPVPNPVL